MAKRLDLQKKLEEVLGTRNVYFQPPESIKLNYPCVIYDLSNEKNLFADDIIYKSKNIYTITIIDKNPDSLLPHKIRDSFCYCNFNRAYSADNLHHFVYELYY